MQKGYIGDSVYARVNDVGQLVLTTENGLPTDPSNTIYLERETFVALIFFAKQHWGYRE